MTTRRQPSCRHRAGAGDKQAGKHWAGVSLYLFSLSILLYSVLRGTLSFLLFLFLSIHLSHHLSSFLSSHAQGWVRRNKQRNRKRVPYGEGLVSPSPHLQGRYGASVYGFCSYMLLLIVPPTAAVLIRCFFFFFGSPLLYVRLCGFCVS
jgi:hypothetical protein